MALGGRRIVCSSELLYDRHHDEQESPLRYRCRSSCAPRLIGDLRNLFARAAEFAPIHQLPVLMQLISSQFDISARSIDAYIPRRMWIKVLVDINTVLHILQENPTFVRGRCARK